MDFPRMVTSDQGYAAASDVPFPKNTLSSLLKSPFPEPNNDWDTPLDFWCNPHISVEDLYENGSSQASPALWVDTPTVITGMSIPAGAAQPDCKLQPRVYSRSTALTGVYVPPPSGQVVELHCKPPDQPDFQHDTPLNMVVPLRVTDIAVDPSMWPDVSACEYSPPASSFSLGSYQPGADTNHSYCRAKPPQHPFSFTVPPVEAEHEGMLPCHDVLSNGPQLTSPNYIPPQFSLHSSMRMGRSLPMLDVSTSPTADAYGAMSGSSSPAYMQSNIFSSGAGISQSSAAMEMSTAAIPTGLPNSSMNQTLTPPESGSFTVPTSPSPSVNQGGSTRRRSPCTVALMVKTISPNLHDGFKWKKYGEKVIKKSKFKRSYFKCDEGDRRQCKVLKRIQMCEDGEHILFTYSCRHNHP